MGKRPAQTEWNGDVRRAVRKFADLGIREAPPTPLFDWCDHVTVTVDGLDGIGVIHQRSSIDPFRLCVFEPSERAGKGFVEVFERALESLDELPQKVAEWRSFRSKPGLLESTAALQDHRKWLGAVAREKKKHLDAIRESGRLRKAGDSPGACRAAGFDVKFGPALPADTPPIAGQRLLADFQAIAPDLLAWHFPRDDKGKWPLGRRSPLFRFHCSVTFARPTSHWIFETASGRLTIDTTGSGNRLPLSLWRRPEDVDLLREGLLAPNDLPTAVASQL